ncbi:hypothetical protein [Rhizobium leguminosarum]|uniref:hypothetical protein n=1 Tax=Rhizobium leguminosarum TaxID=384 RepID=UPI001FE0BF3C|nr:hypothetical protein [Rhizobium leguminosarum]
MQLDLLTTEEFLSSLCTRLRTGSLLPRIATGTAVHRDDVIPTDCNHHHRIAATFPSGDHRWATPLDHLSQADRTLFLIWHLPAFKRGADPSWKWRLFFVRSNNQQGLRWVLFIAIGFVVAHIALATAIFALRGGDQLWVLGLVFGWYCFAMFGLIVYLWVRHRKSTGRG